MEPTPWWINYTNNLILWTTLFTHDRGHHLFCFTCVELELASINNPLVKLHILPRIFNSLLDDIDTHHLLGVLAEANPYGTRTAANVEQSRFIVDLGELCDQGQHFLENNSIDLEEGKRRDSESETAKHLFVVTRSAQDFPFIALLVSTTQVSSVDDR